MLETYIRSRLAEKKILLMTHIVIGYPSLEASLEIVRSMVEAGVDLMELQIPFSEPIADGPVILKANQQALANGVTVEQCLDFGHGQRFRRTESTGAVCGDEVVLLVADAAKVAPLVESVEV